MKRCLSGAEKRKQKKLRMEKAVSSSMKIDQFIIPCSTAVTDQSTSLSTVIDQSTSLSTVIDQSTAFTEFNSLPDDPGTWPDVITDDQRCDLVKRGPVQVISSAFPYDDDCPRRRFSTSYYNRIMRNGELVQRKWLIYSNQRNCVFCFACKLFGQQNISLRHGCSTWNGLSKHLHEHETTSTHILNMENWNDLHKGIVNKATIDEKNVEQMIAEKEYWRNVL